MTLHIILIGNHVPAFSTESELDWTIESRLGHAITKIQENTQSVEDVLCAARLHRPQLLIWVHTHGWNLRGDLELMLRELQALGVRTCSFHLDRFWGLEQLDKRESRIGQHPFWKTDVVFSADGGNQEGFLARGVNHVWLPPGVVERGCYFGDFNPAYDSPVAFAGASGYHPEYPFRSKLVQELDRRYTNRFRLIQGLREKLLNDAFASVRVVAGDSCFAGSPYYWSDRVPETIGRGGFLIFPETPGLSIPGLVTYRPQDIDDLCQKIDYFLDDANQEERHVRLMQSHTWVKENATYTVRVRTMFQTLGLE